MKAILKKMKSLWSDESAQGATEYILLLVVVVGISLIFGPQIKEIVKSKMGALSEDIKGFTPQSGQ